MKMDHFVFFPLLVSLPILLSALSFSKSRQHRKIEFRRLSEFYLSLALLLSSAWFLPDMGPAFVILSMLPWLWTLRTAGLICGEISGKHLFSKFHSGVLILGGVISIIFLSFDFELSMVTAPFALSVGLIGLSFILQTYSQGKIRDYGFLHHFNLVTILLFFLYRLCFPLIISQAGGSGITEVVETYFVVIFCLSLYPLFAQKVFEGQVLNLEKVLETRNKQLFGHSSFSEYRVLSAGLSHEINNALTIINAKITRLIMGRSADLEKDLHVIQNASNRITRSIRALRDFIYPSEIQENLDLGEVIQGVLILYGQRLINHDVRIKHEGMNGKIIRGNKVQLEQIFLSMINNSVDAINGLPDKWISLSAKTVGDDVEITYQDSSPSRAKEMNSFLNDPLHVHYEFLDNEIRLVLAREIAQKHGGHFSCVPASEFSTYKLIFPLADVVKSSDVSLKEKINEFRELH